MSEPITETTPPTDPVSVEDLWSFTTDDGRVITMTNPAVSVINVGFSRRNRYLDDGDFTFAAIEAVAGLGRDAAFMGVENPMAAAPILDAVDRLSPSEWRRFNAEFLAYLRTSRGE